ncbi:MAG: septum formation initiator family protein [Erysipelotrichaceae bacterium]
MKKKPVKLIVSLILLVICSAFIFRAVKLLLVTFDLKAKISESNAKIVELEKENSLLVQQKEKLLDPEYVKNYARGVYMYSKDGEQIFHLSPEKGE